MSPVSPSKSAARVGRTMAKSEATQRALMEAALEVASEKGVRGVTHRRVAAAAGVSLGVTSYHYAHIDDMLLDAFRHWVANRSATWESQFKAASTHEDVVEATITLIGGIHDDARDRILLYELYAQTVRDERYQELATAWSNATRSVIAEVYPAHIAQQLEAVWEGLSVQLVLGGSIERAEDGLDLIRLVLNQVQPSRSASSDAPVLATSSD